MQKFYRPNLGGFEHKLGLKNGLEELIKRPVPQQETLYLSSNDINDPAFDGKLGNNYNMRRNYHGRRRRRRLTT